MAGIAGAKISILVKVDLHMKPKSGTIWPIEKTTHQIILAQSIEVHTA